MAKNIWKVNGEINEHPNRNNFDLSYQNHMTMKMGTLYPFMCKEVVPGDKFKIDTAFGLKFMPLVFPVQSKMTAYVHYFYVRNKNLWKNWQNWLNGLEEHTHPYIEQPASFFKTGSLADYLDIPTSVIQDGSKVVPYYSSRQLGRFDNWHYNNGTVTGANGQQITFDVQYTKLTFLAHTVFAAQPATRTFWTGIMQQDTSISVNSVYGNVAYVGKLFSDYKLSSLPSTVYCVFPFGGYVAHSAGIIPFDNGDISHSSHPLKSYWRLAIFSRLKGSNDPWYAVSIADDPDVANGKFTFSFLNLPSYDDEREYCFGLALKLHDGFNTSPYSITTDKDGQVTDVLDGVALPNPVLFGFNQEGIQDSPIDTPFADDASENHRVKISALPFRAYEAVYQAYYRNTQNQEFYVDGVPQYNRYNTTLEDGADTTPYHLEQRNYEMDFLTSALPSPQQGVAPLVGMSALGEVTIEDENGITTGRAVLADDNETITNIVLTSPAASVDHARTVVNIASAGMSINDFRNTNAFTRWLECNLRKGYKYRDFIAGHFGQAPEYRELDMPEFIGGTSQVVSVNSVTNMADTESISGNKGTLGSFVGSANCFGATRHSATHYCDDYGFIIGILCVVPTPSYSQLLPKMYLKNDKLDYYFPEFSQLGLQPITYKEVTPIQSYQECIAQGSSKKMTDTFGYQRPNYDLVGYVDQVHGQFRTSLSSFLIHRVFGSRPELGTEFLQIHPEETNQIFAYTNPADDTILGQIVVNISAKRPVPRVTIPSLGR